MATGRTRGQTYRHASCTSSARRRTWGWGGSRSTKKRERPWSIHTLIFDSTGMRFPASWPTRRGRTPASHGRVNTVLSRTTTRRVSLLPRPGQSRSTTRRSWAARWGRPRPRVCGPVTASWFNGSRDVPGDPRKGTNCWSGPIVSTQTTGPTKWRFGPGSPRLMRSGTPSAGNCRSAAAGVAEDAGGMDPGPRRRTSALR